MTERVEHPVEPSVGEGALHVEVVGNDTLRLGFLPTLGGRLISVECEGTELLWRNEAYLDAELRTVKPRHTWKPLDSSMGSWANVGGSKTWPAPQGWSGPHEWAGPPDPVLDSGEWTWAATSPPGSEVSTVMCTSPDDPRTGLRVTREFVLPAHGNEFQQRNTFTNASTEPVTWSIWELCQVGTSQFFEPGRLSYGTGHDAGIRVGVAGTAEPVSMVEAVGAIRVNAPSRGIREVVVEEVVAKVGFTDSTGSLGILRPDGAFIDWSFSVPQGSYPDGGCQVELWMQFPTPRPLPALGGLHPSAHLVELEVLSPLEGLDPGESVSQTIAWRVGGAR